MNVEQFIQKLKESESYKKFQADLFEMNVTGAVDGYQTPKAFAPSSKAFRKKSKENSEVLGYKLVPDDQKKRNTESVYVQAMKTLSEGSYKNYKTDETLSTKQKINNSIKEINSSIYKIERVVGHASRLKMEMNVDQRSLWMSSHQRLRKIAERLNRINKQINELGA